MTYDVSLDGPIRDLTASRLATRPIRSDLATVYRDARDARDALRESGAYMLPPSEFNSIVPALRFADFTKGFAR
jgi:hypothetical protein